MIGNQLALTFAEGERLATCEAVIERGLKTFVDVGNALAEIRDGRLYRQSHGTFEEYCRDRWGMERRQAYRLMDAADAVANVSNWTQTVPAVESQARPLTMLEPEQQPAAWQEAVETAPNGKVTAAHVAEVVSRYRNGTGINRYTEVGNGVKQCDVCGELWAADLPYCPYCNISPEARMAYVTQERRTPHVAHNSGENEWYTPPEYIAAARAVMGDIDTDPASSAKANETVQARIYHTAEDDGLAHMWRGRVWMNPPYSQPLIGRFCSALRGEVEAGRVYEAITLTNNATETAWFADLLANAAAVCFVRGRVRFIDKDGNPGGAPLQGQAIVYMGQNAARFAEHFGQFGAVLYA